MNELNALERGLPPTNDQNLATCVNAYATECVAMLNALSTSAEGKLARAERRIEEAEMRVRLLERALLDGRRGRTVAEEEPSAVAAAAPPPPLPPDGSAPEPPPPVEEVVAPPPMVVDEPADEDDALSTQPQRDAVVNPAHAIYFKMLKMGVPEQAVRNKMALEGVDPSVLDG